MLKILLVLVTMAPGADPEVQVKVEPSMSACFADAVALAKAMKAPTAPGSGVDIGCSAVFEQDT